MNPVKLLLPNLRNYGIVFVIMPTLMCRASMLFAQSNVISNTVADSTKVNAIVLATQIPSSHFIVKSTANDDRPVRNYVCFIPSKARVINGWAISSLLGFSDMPYDGTDTPTREVNGLHTNLSPLPALVLCMAIPIVIGQGISTLGGKLNPKHGSASKSEVNPPMLNAQDSSKNKERMAALSRFQADTLTKFTLKGVSISTFELAENSAIEGVELSAVFNSMPKIDGVTVAPVFTFSRNLRGVAISTVNITTGRSHGLQLGLVNVAKSFKGIQLGLWNKNQKRSLPFMNFNFKS